MQEPLRPPIEGLVGVPGLRLLRKEKRLFPGLGEAIGEGERDVCRLKSAGAKQAVKEEGILSTDDATGFGTTDAI